MKVHRNHLAITHIHEVLTPQYLTQYIHHFHVELLIDITQKPDIKPSAARVGIDPDSIGKQVMPFNTIVHRNIHIERSAASLCAVHCIRQVLHPNARCHCVEHIARYPGTCPHPTRWRRIQYHQRIAQTYP